MRLGVHPPNPKITALWINYVSGPILAYDSIDCISVIFQSKKLKLLDGKEERKTCKKKNTEKPSSYSSTGNLKYQTLSCTFKIHNKVNIVPSCLINIPTIHSNNIFISFIHTKKSFHIREYYSRAYHNKKKKILSQKIYSLYLSPIYILEEQKKNPILLPF